MLTGQSLKKMYMVILPCFALQASLDKFLIALHDQKQKYLQVPCRSVKKK